MLIKKIKKKNKKKKTFPIKVEIKKNDIPHKGGK